MTGLRICTEPDPRAAIAALVGAAVSRVGLRPLPEATTAEIDLAVVELADGSVIELVLKDLGHRASSARRRVTPPFVHDAEREPWAYATVLAGSDSGPGAGPDERQVPQVLGRWRPSGDAADRLVLERVAGTQLRYTDDRRAWRDAGRWLGALHRDGDAVAAAAGRALCIDRRWHAAWAERARRFHPGAASVIDRIEAVLDEWEPGGVAVLHGDVGPANVLARDGRVTAVVDWEMTAVGDPLHDLAGLVAGDLPTPLFAAVIEGYAGAAGIVPDAAWYDRLRVARLLVCLQWLGWASPEVWSPPAGQRRSWACDARRLLRPDVAHTTAARRP